jgi:hypothetical protein
MVKGLPPCKEGQERNPATRRCKKIVKVKTVKLRRKRTADVGLNTEERKIFDEELQRLREGQLKGVLGKEPQVQLSVRGCLKKATIDELEEELKLRKKALHEYDEIAKNQRVEMVVKDGKVKKRIVL